MPLPQLIGGASALAQLIAGIMGMKPQVDQINPYTGDQMSALSQQYQDAMSKMAAQMAQSQAAQQQVRGTERDISGLERDVSRLDQPDANEWYDNFLQQVPGYQELAANLAESATEQLGRSLEDQTALLTQQAVTQAQNQFAGSRGGAAQAALGQAVAQPLAQAQTQLAGQKANIESGAFGQLAGQGQQLTAQSTQNEFANALQTLMSQLGAFNQLGQLQTGRAGQALQGANIFGNLAQSAQQQRTQMADPIFQERANPFAPLALGIGAASDIFTNPDYGFFNPKVG